MSAQRWDFANKETYSTAAFSTAGNQPDGKLQANIRVNTAELEDI
jgi:hypothetical protein